jgi:predicted dehydrogenase
MDIDAGKGADFNTFHRIMNEYRPTHVSIATPNHTHAGILGLLLMWYSRGIEIICEKPLCINRFDAGIIETQARGRAVHYIAQNRYLKTWQKALELLTGRKDIKIEYKAQLVRGPDYYNESPWRGNIYQDGGPLYTQLSHHIDFLYYLGLDLVLIDAVYGQAGCYRGITTVESWGRVRFNAGRFDYDIYPDGEQKIEMVITAGDEWICTLGRRYLEKIDWPGGELEDDVAQNVYAGGGGTAAHHYLQFKAILEGGCPVALKEGLNVVRVITDWYKTRPRAGY